MNDVKVEKIKPVFEDERGIITDVLNEKINHVGVIVTEKDTIRANHYHEKSTQYSYILSGKFEVLIAKHDNPKEVKKFIIGPGDLITIPPFNIHRFKAIEKAVMIDIISESRAGTGYEDDVFRIEIEEEWEV